MGCPHFSVMLSLSISSPAGSVTGGNGSAPERRLEERAGGWEPLLARGVPVRVQSAAMKEPAEASVSMVREHLRGIPQHDLPAGFSTRWYRRGDEALWRRIESSADRLNEITPELFGSEFGADPEVLAARMCFLLAPGGEAIGTATAWYDSNHRGRPYGRVHWVAVLPEWQGRGLSKPLMTIVCNRLAHLDHTCAYLVTSTLRPRAIRLYLGFGFLPEISSASEEKAWRLAEPTLGVRLPWDAIERRRGEAGAAG
jgi:GNAT superfamily N-acetyltransferase